MTKELIKIRYPVYRAEGKLKKYLLKNSFVEWIGRLITNAKKG
jgi:predicted CopG family antitoxin